MRRADRLFQIVQQLRGGRLVRARELAERLEVSERTIYRDIADLQTSGVPIDGAAGVGYVMRSGYDMPPLMFTRDELVALIAGARLIRAWGGLSMAQAAEEALVKIDAVLPASLRGKAEQLEIHAMAPGLTADVRLKIDRLEMASDRRERLAIVYCDADGRETRRTVRPLGLWFWGKVWTLIGWCEFREDFRMFRVDRVQAIEPEGDTFRQEPGKTLKDFYRSMLHDGQRPPS